MRIDKEFRPELIVSTEAHPFINRAVPSYTAGAEGTMSISFNPQLLLQLARAMGSEYVTLTFSAPDAPIRVQHPTDPRVIGVLMPL